MTIELIPAFEIGYNNQCVTGSQKINNLYNRLSGIK